MAENFVDFIARSAKGAGKDVENVGKAVSESAENIKPSFQHAYEQAKAGEPRHLAIKGAGVALGVYMSTHGINNIIRGATEEIEHPAHDGRTVQNTTRIFWGGAETMIGLTSLYFGLTKGQVR